MKIKKDTDYLGILGQDELLVFLHSVECKQDYWICPQLNNLKFTQKEMQVLLDNHEIEEDDMDISMGDLLDEDYIDILGNQSCMDIFPDRKEKAVKLPTSYDPTLTNSSIELDKLAMKLSSALSKPECPDCLSILLSGVPGLGKSEAALYIANKLNKQLHTVPIANMLDKWVGSSEKNIKAAFDKAQKANAIILIDEVDAISGVRDNNLRNHEISTVNSLLQTLDKFKGICMFTTNSTSRMDKAILRRCMLHITMDNMTTSQADRMARKIFPRRRIKNLADLTFAPADFIKVRNQLLFIDTKEINREYIIRQLQDAAQLRTGHDSRNPSIKAGFI